LAAEFLSHFEKKNLKNKKSLYFSLGKETECGERMKVREFTM